MNEQEHIILLLKLDGILTDINFEVDYDRWSASKLAEYWRELINDYFYKQKQNEKKIWKKTS